MINKKFEKNAAVECYQRGIKTWTDYGHGYVSYYGIKKLI